METRLFTVLFSFQTVQSFSNVGLLFARKRTIMYLVGLKQTEKVCLFN